MRKFINFKICRIGSVTSNLGNLVFDLKFEVRSQLLETTNGVTARKGSPSPEEDIGQQEEVKLSTMFRAVYDGFDPEKEVPPAAD